MTRTWKKDIEQMVMDYYRHAWNSPLTLEEEFRGMCRKHRNEIASREMVAFFTAKCKEWKAFYSDTKTVVALMAYSH